jgi:hypothetical protein
MKDIRGSITLPADLRGYIVLDGDAPGHEFHGNQWSGGGGKTDKTSSTLTSSERAAIVAYAGLGNEEEDRTHEQAIFEKLNSGLRSGTGDTTGIAHDLLSAIDKQPPTDEPSEYFRGLTSEGAEALLGSAPKVGAEFVDKGFVSTTTDHYGAEDYAQWGSGAGTVLHVNVPSGAHILPIGKALGMSPSAEIWHEHILPPGGTFKVTSVAQSKDGFNHVAVDYVPRRRE